MPLGSLLDPIVFSLTEQDEDMKGMTISLRTTQWSLKWAEKNLNMNI